MPIVNVSGPALDVEKKRDLARRLTEVMSDVYQRPAGHIIVIIQENPPENVSIGGKLVADRPPANP
ncbi:MAG: 4-oxalocrotonate tautomerase family protein [Armatimonadota bacterium]|nr:4-oxalocrotonate tautomerase family protein [Armatimonadota bacterium]